MPGLVEERGASGSMTGRKDDLYLAAAKVYHLAVEDIPDLTLVASHAVRNERHVARVQKDLRERPYAARMVAVGMGQHHSDGLGSNLRHNLIQLRNNRSSINQECAVITLNKVERLVINSVSVPYPCMLVKLAEHHLIILINYFAAKVTTVDVCVLCPDRKRHQAKQQGCNKKTFVSHNLSDIMRFS